MPELELKYRIAACLDVVDFLDIIGIGIEELVEFLEEEIEEHQEELERACR